MEAFKKQAARLREQVAKQQQAVLKHLGHSHLANDSVIFDEAESECYQKLQNLYTSTRKAKHFQKHIVRGVEGFVSVSTKQMETARRLAQDSCKFGTDDCTDSHVARAVLQFGASHNLMENERETLLGLLDDQVCKPLRALITGAPLEDARHLTHRYHKLRQEVEAQAAEVQKRRSKTRDSEISAENCMKLRGAEARLAELKSTMMALGREATDAMLSVEDQQQQITVQRLFSMVDAERCYHQHVLTILDKLQAEMILEEQLNEPSLQTLTANGDAIVPPAKDHGTSNGSSGDQMHANKEDSCFIAKVIHPFDAEAEGELSLSIDDYVVVRQVAPTGWSEGECKGKAGWFPSAYVQKYDKAPVYKLTDATQSTP
ncbi:hypothetical protein Tsubulata_036651 [Turnera subulata]|uniref:SH3 domain-containing protein n=1 Tax=Turnera subulata TaxID=218843 RepID=A0A9Q0FQI3_9ROSI|nr:hypothetical protein Tsubulata_036651 [Turnera subulata]